MQIVTKKDQSTVKLTVTEKRQLQTAHDIVDRLAKLERAELLDGHYQAQATSKQFGLLMAAVLDNGESSDG